MTIPLATEIVLLGWSVVLLFVHIQFQAATMTREQGTAWNMGARDGAAPVLGTLAGRAQRALDNYKETWPAFVALALGLAVADRSGGIGALGAILWFGARIVYLPLYLLGVPYLRTAAYLVSLAGLLLMLVRLL